MIGYLGALVVFALYALGLVGLAFVIVEGLYRWRDRG